MNHMYTEAFWKAVSETAETRGLIDAAVIVYCRVYGLPVSECCSLIGLGAKRVKAILNGFDACTSAIVLGSDTDKLSA